MIADDDVIASLYQAAAGDTTWGNALRKMVELIDANSCQFVAIKKAIDRIAI